MRPEPQNCNLLYRNIEFPNNLIWNFDEKQLQTANVSKKILNVVVGLAI